MPSKAAWELLDEELFAQVLMALGYATGAAFQTGDKLEFENFLRLANKLCLGKRGYHPYEVHEAGRRYGV